MTSDGHTGTLSHLTISNNPDLFAEDLRALVGKAGVSVCLAGGWEGSPESIQLVNELAVRLAGHGFVISLEPLHADVLGRYSRQSTIYADHVDVRRKLHQQGSKAEVGSLSFPVNA